MNFKSILTAVAVLALMGGAASAKTIGVATFGGSPVDTSAITGPERADLAAAAGVAESDVIGYFIPLDDDCVFGDSGCGLSADSGSGGALEMSIDFDPVTGGSAQVLKLWFEDLDLVGSNDPTGFFESLTVFDEGGQIAQFTSLGDDGISIVSGAGTDVILHASIDLSVPGSTLTALLNFTSDGFGTNTPEYLVATLEPVPLPAGVVLMGTALAGFGVMRRRAKRKAA